jgi:hypothetical protein
LEKKKSLNILGYLLELIIRKFGDLDFFFARNLANLGQFFHEKAFA